MTPRLYFQPWPLLRPRLGKLTSHLTLRQVPLRYLDFGTSQSCRFTPKISLLLSLFIQWIQPKISVTSLIFLFPSLFIPKLSCQYYVPNLSQFCPFPSIFVQAAIISCLDIALVSAYSLCMLDKLLQSCPTLCGPMDCSPPGSSVHGILQARILEWVAISSSRGSS